MATPTMMPAGWYTDPARRHEYRYWSGTDWSTLVSDNAVTATDPLESPPQSPVPESPPTTPVLESPPPPPYPAPVSESPPQSPVTESPPRPLPAAPAADVARRGRRRWVVPVIAIVAVLGLIVGLVIWAPWQSPPLLRPTGLVAGSSTTSSITFHWSRPATGPAPDRYVILHNGRVTGSVPGTVTSYRSLGLAPATAYQYRVAAVRGGKRSPLSSVLVVSTLVPPVSAGRLQGPWNTQYKVIKMWSAVAGSGGTYSVGQGWTDSWSFSPKCAAGPCAVVLSGVWTGPGNYAAMPFTVTLARAGAVYTGTTAAHITKCGPGTGAPVHNTLTFRITVSKAGVANGTWTASSWDGTMVLSSPYTSASATTYCPAQSVTTAISGSP